MKNCKHVVPILGAFCLMASLSFMPKEAWAESSLAPISQQQGSYQLTGTILDGITCNWSQCIGKRNNEWSSNRLKWKVQFTSKAKRHSTNQLYRL